MATLQPTITLNDGTVIPQIGFGVWKIEDDKAEEAVKSAVGAGYRSIDTAKAYGNEAGVGRGLKTSGVARDELFVTTKLWNDDHGYDETLRAFDASMANLQLDVLDLYLIHWPVQSGDRYVDTWKALVKLKQEGRVRAIGVSNFMEEHLDRIVESTGVKPVLNQIEVHPTFQQLDMRAIHRRMGIATEAWSPLGQGDASNSSVLKAIGEKHGKSSVQVAIRWHIESGTIAIPKSANPKHIESNFDVFDFRLDDEDMRKIASLDDADGRVGPNPESFPG